MEARLISKECSEPLLENKYKTIFYKQMASRVSEYHYHDYFEISILLDCTGVSYIWKNQEYILKSGDIVLCNMFEPHMFRWIDGFRCDRFNLSVDLQMLLDCSTLHVSLLKMFQPSNSGYPIFNVGMREFHKYLNLIESYERPPLPHGQKMLEKGLIQQLLAYLYNECYEKMGEQESLVSVKQAQLISQVVRYIEDHLGEEISLGLLSKQVNYSIPHITRVFKQTTSETVTSYIKNKRMNLAAEYLSNDIPITEIAEKIGFRNYSCFYKAFLKSYGMSPSEYRNKYKSLDF